jgi:hypothetical protein
VTLRAGLLDQFPSGAAGRSEYEQLHLAPERSSLTRRWARLASVSRT